ncbi:glycosyltransferase [Paracrocinitomix mangrovi]|uniref:glycosyltransferase n=1 Tax=Paracrocinitomix mangrovi TaxID=2862509 RepID=UPI001C8DF0D5|nr:glycosyltransferase [Paracrocinitomix mangrovi]UKN03308.1 glycosyltransferase [Paracrocinitomix mangrovi]
MKVLFLANFYPNTTQPYRGAFFREQAKAVANQEVSVDIISPILFSVKDKVVKEDFQLKSFEEKSGINVLTKGATNYGGRFEIYQEKKFVQIAIRLYKKYVKEHGKPDLIHAHFGIWAGWAAYKIGKKFNVPYIITEHSSHLLKDSYSSSTKKKLQKLYDNAASVIVVGTELKDKLEKKFNLNQVNYIPNVVDTNLFKPIDVQKENLIVDIGQLRKLKRFDLLIEAFSILKNDFPDYKLEIIGQGPERSNLEKLIQKLGLQDAVNLPGPKTHQEITGILSKAKLFAHCSEVETFGVVYIEAMAVGLPCVATNTGGAQMLINESNGLLCEKWESTEIAKQMIKAIRQIENYKPEDIRKQVVSQFSFEVVGEKIRSVYRDSIKN